MDEPDDDAINKPLTEINMIPLIDVMLVLLVLFILTAPLLIPNDLKVEVPQVTTVVSNHNPDIFELVIDKQGNLFLNNEALDMPQLISRLTLQKSLPEIRLQADKTLAYQNVMNVLANIQKAGITQITFVTESPQNEIN